MSKRAMLLSGMLIMMVVLAACGGQPAGIALQTQTPDAMMATSDAMMHVTPDAMMHATPEAMMQETPSAMMATPDTMMPATLDKMMANTPEAMMQETPGAMMATPNAMMTTPETMMGTPGWFSASLTNAATGAAFSIQDFKGKVVLVETMAMWCPTCLRQGKEVKVLHDQLGTRDDLVSVSIDIDLNEKLADLKGYTGKNGFDWTFTAATPDVAREVGDLYGQQFLNPTSAPMLIIDRHGQAHPLPFGVKSAADLQNALEPFLNEAM